MLCLTTTCPRDSNGISPLRGGGLPTTRPSEEATFMLNTIDARARTKLTGAVGAVVLFLSFAFSPIAESAQPASSGKGKPTVVLVHGAWADGSSWNGVIARLLKSGYTVYAPPNSLRGLASDAATIATFVKSIPGPVILVGHSYGGAVISVAAPSDPNVKALVYVDAFAPDEGESPLSLLALYPAPPKDFFTAVPFASGGDADVYLAQKYYGPVFASDVPTATASIMAVAQRPLTNSALNEIAPAAEGWKTIPSWYVVGDADKVIPPPLQMMMAQRAKAHITHVQRSHPSMIQHPEATVAAIMAADRETESSPAAK
jgi:pimeloyl-ACP methyl ester carboxylesterase